MPSRRSIASSAAILGLTLLATPAFAVPSFARQTGMSCSACHTSFPELTPFGRAFKAGGYTLTTTKTITEAQGDRSILEVLGYSPLGAMMQTSYTHTDRSQPSTTPGHADAKNDDFSFPDQLSLFYAGKIAPGLGAFAQLTYDFVSDHFSMDNTDVRFARTFTPGDKDLILGLTLNNNPTVTDLWQGTPAWGQPFISSQVAPAPGAATLINGGLAQQVIGANAYAFWNNTVYAEIGLYHSSPIGVPRPLDATTGATNIIDGYAPYWRAAVQKETDHHAFEIGTYGMEAQLYPGGALDLVGPRNEYVDVAFDAQYQYLGETNNASLVGTWIHENSTPNGAYAAAGLMPSRNDQLDELRFSGTYLYNHVVGGRVSWFSVSGTTDSVLYSPTAVSGSASGSPRSQAMQEEVDVNPWLNVRLGLQYTHYFVFNGAETDYDGAGRNASANDTLFAFVWLAF